MSQCDGLAIWRGASALQWSIQCQLSGPTLKRPSAIGRHLTICTSMSMAIELSRMCCLEQLQIRRNSRSAAGRTPRELAAGLQADQTAPRFPLRNQGRFDCCGCFAVGGGGGGGGGGVEPVE